MRRYCFLGKHQFINVPFQTFTTLSETLKKTVDVKRFFTNKMDPFNRIREP